MLGWFYRQCDRVRCQARRRKWSADLALGRHGEDLAHRHLQEAGMVVVARNWRTRSGSAEVDLIARDGEALVFVEVKSRTSADYGAPERAIDAVKRHKIARAAWDYCRLAEWDQRLVRFDVVTVVFAPAPSLTHFRDAFGVEFPR